MSEDTPDKVEEQPEEPAAKKKIARKRSKAPEPSSEPSSEKGPEGKPAAPESDDSSSQEKPAATDAQGSSDDSGGNTGRPPMEDGETPTENPSIRRISSKRKSNQDSNDGDESPDQIPTIVEPPSADGQNKKRRRRRRKGSGDGDDGGSGGSDDGRQSSRSSSRVPLDPEKLEKKAWKIFLSEVSEEGLALVSDQDAKEIGRRSFRLAEIFLEEASKRQ